MNHHDRFARAFVDVMQVQALPVEVASGVVGQKAPEVLAHRLSISRAFVTIPGRASGN